MPFVISSPQEPLGGVDVVAIFTFDILLPPRFHVGFTKDVGKNRTEMHERRWNPGVSDQRIPVVGPRIVIF
jgi:hypothetical protein